MVGTPFYMSPELVSGRGYDEKSDIWALGCVIYEIAVLRPPFNSILRSEEELKRNITHSTPKKLPSMYSEALSAVVFSLLEKDSSKRPSAQDLLKLRNVDLVLKLEKARKELTAVREKRASLREQMAALQIRAEKVAQLEKQHRPGENHANFV
jgi:NIMA (never in mitosis gene a)-related kinase